MLNSYRTIVSASMIIGLGTAAFSIHAHPTLEQQSAPAGSYYKATLKLGHGCDGAATTGVTVLIPEGVVGVKPMPKAGWTLETKKARLAVPHESHGKRIDEAVAAVTWSGGSLPDAFYDEFVMTMKLPDTPGKRWFKVQQSCASGRSDWVQIPEVGQTVRDLRFPAAALDILPAAETHKH